MRVWTTVGAVLLLSTSTVLAGPALTLVREGQPAATIVIAADPPKAVLFAACELQWFVQKMTGALLPIVQDDQPVAGTKILVGESSLTRALGYKNEGFGLREYTVKFLPDTLLLMGRDDPDRSELKYEVDTAYDSLPNLYSDRGSAFAVYDLLEKYCGVRWYRPGPIGLVYPEKTTLTVSGPDIRRSPMSRHLQLYYGNVEGFDGAIGLQPRDSLERAEITNLLYEEIYAKYDPKKTQANLLARRKEVMLYLHRMRTGGEPFAGNHSFYGYYDRFWEKNPQKPELWEEAHPEWFAQGYEGKPPQMRYTSRGFIEQVIKDAREYFDTGKKYPGAQAFGEYFALCPMDNSSYSKDPEEQALFNQDEASNMQFNNGRWSDLIWGFTNEVAKEVRKTHPDKYLVQLAYAQYAYYPRHIRLEPNIAVQLCLHIRNWWCPSMEVNDVKMLTEWATKEPGRPLYMFNYYCFPQENSGYGKSWHCFPGFFGHAAARQAQLYKKYGVRGIFFCGVPTDPDHYFVTKMYDDPDLNFDQALDEYFKLYYGAAAEPLKQIYLKIEDIFGNPKNYPLHIQRDNRHYHQNVELAWGYLGTEKRMAELQELMDQANALAQTEMEKRRVLVFQREIWDYMVQGKRKYMEGLGQNVNAGKAIRAQLLRRGGPLRDPGEVDFIEATPLYGWRQASGEPTKRLLRGQVAHDKRYLYLELTDASGDTPKSDPEITGGDYWQVLLAEARGAGYRALLVNPEGKVRSQVGPPETAGNEPPWESLAKVTSSVAGGEWVTRIALPLSKVVADGIEPGEQFFMNVVRRSGTDDDQPMWASTQADFEDTARLNAVQLDEGKALAGLDLDLVPTEPIREGVVGLWEFAEGSGTTVADSSGYGAEGKLINGPTWGTGRHGKAVELNGYYRWVDLGLEPQFVLQTLALETWVKFTTMAGYAAVMGRGYAEGGSYSLHIRYGDGSIWFELGDTQGKRHIYNPREAAVPVGEWCHIVGTYDGQTMRVYLNGREVGSGLPVQLTIAEGKSPLTVGYLPQNGWMVGLVDEAAIYDRALTREEVWQNYLWGRRK